MTDIRKVTVPPDLAKARLDKVLSALLPDITRQRLASLIREGQVTCNTQPMENVSYKVKAGETYIIAIPPPEMLDVVAQPIPLDIVYEDADVLVINKAAGMVVHPAAGHPSGTLVNALLYHCKDSLSGIGGAMRPGIVHRLDKDTSGLMMVAKNDIAHQSLSHQLQDRSLSRVYHAWCYSAMQPPSGIIDAAIGRSPLDRKKMAVTESGKVARTHYRTLAHYKSNSGALFASALECVLETGRTHQIRVHCAQAGCSLIGDTTYGMALSKRLGALRKMVDAPLYDTIEALPQQALHAKQIRFMHPKQRIEMRFEAPYPPALQLLDAALQEYVCG